MPEKQISSPAGTSLSSAWRKRAAACADTLAAGFSTEPLYTFMCPDKRRRRDAGSFRALLWALGRSYDMADFCEEALEALSATSGKATVVPIEESKREGKG